MAELKTLEFILNEYTQEEIIETRQVVGDDNVITTKEVLIQDYFHIGTKLVLSLKPDPEKNQTKITAVVKVFATAGEKGEGFTLSQYETGNTLNISGVKNSPVREDYNHSFVHNINRTIPAGASVDYIFCGTDAYGAEFTHLIDGTKNINISAKSYYKVNGVIGLGEKKFTGSISQNIELPTFDRSTQILTASNFTDEENPTITYEAINGKSLVALKNNSRFNVVTDSITSLQACISFDGVTPDIDYREIPTNTTSYTFYFTDAEREVIRNKIQGSTTVPIYYLIKTVRNAFWDGNDSDPANDCNESKEFLSKTKRNLTVVGSVPTVNPTVKDIKLETLELTGDENTFIRYESMAEYAINATASKGASIVSQSVQCGSKIIYDLPYGIIDNVESGTFIFNATDSRNMGVSGSVFKELIEYVKPTCYQQIEIQITGETGANIKVMVNGNYYNGSFGAVNNTLKLEVRYTDNNGNWGAWQTISGTPTYNNNTYHLETILTGFNYGDAYTFQCRATDKLNVVTSTQYIVKMLPVFDWGESDFNFNVPVNINADKLNMHNETILQRSETTNTTILSGNDGVIYIRPKGTEDPAGQIIINPDGNVKFNGTVTFEDGSVGGDPTNYFADYVIETGYEEMGTNGMWYWRKWKSGKSEAWGCRNFGNMGVSTAWGNLYRSAIFTQDLPDKVFIRTPDAININIVHATFGGWICKHEQTAPSAVTTGSFIFVRPASATVTAPTNIGFYIIGEWK